MTIQEVIKEYGKAKKYFVKDLYEGIYYERINEGVWYDELDHNYANFDTDKAIKFNEYVDEQIIIITIDTSSR